MTSCLWPQQVSTKRAYLDECMRSSSSGLSGEKWCVYMLNDAK